MATGGNVLIGSDLKAIIDSIHLITIHSFLQEKWLWDFVFYVKGGCTVDGLKKEQLLTWKNPC